MRFLSQCLAFFVLGGAFAGCRISEKLDSFSQRPLIQNAKSLSRPRNLGLGPVKSEPESLLVTKGVLLRVPNEEDDTSVALASHAEVVEAENGPSVRYVGAADSISTGANGETLRLNLPTALSFVNPRHPTVGFAQWRVQEAYAELQQAKALWLPTIQSGFSFHRHDGNYQASDGRIVDVNRNSFQYGLGTGATGAGTTPQPGVLASFELADAIYQPQIAQRIAWARGHRARGSQNDQLLAVADAYFDLVNAVQDRHIVVESVQRADALAKITRDFAAAGEGLEADADLLETESLMVRNRLFDAIENVATSSARLAEALSLRNGQSIRPLDITAIPIHMTISPMDRNALIQQGLRCRPELKEAQALVAAACERYKREKKAPFIPSILLGLSTGGFGGGLGNELDEIDARYDFDAVATWQLRNLGQGEQAARRQADAQVQQARYQRIQMMDRVAREVTEALAEVRSRQSRIDATQRAVELAYDAHIHQLDRIRDGQGAPIEALQALRSLEESQRAHLQAITEFNQSQFRLHWAVGCPRTEA